MPLAFLIKEMEKYRGDIEEFEWIKPWFVIVPYFLITFTDNFI